LKTIELLQREKSLLEQQPGSKSLTGQKRIIEEQIRFYEAQTYIFKPGSDTSRKDKRIDKKLRRKAARFDSERK